MAKPRQNDSLSHALARAGQKHAKKSLARYMYENFDELTREIGSRADWMLLVLAFNGLGLKDAKGNIPTQSVARQTWYRARKTVARERREASVPVVSVRLSTPLVPQHNQDTGVLSPPYPAREAILPETPAGDQNNTEAKVSAALTQIRSRRIPMPRKIDEA